MTFFDILRCRVKGKNSQRCILALWHKGKHRYRVAVKGKKRAKPFDGITENTLLSGTNPIVLHEPKEQKK